MSNEEIARGREVVKEFESLGHSSIGRLHLCTEAVRNLRVALDEVERLKAENARLMEAGKVLERLGQVASGCFGDLEAYADARNVFKGGE